MLVSEIPLSVALLHNYRDEQQPSMRLYAERLGEALVRRDVRVTRVRPPGVVPAAWRAGSSGWNKVDGYVGRFAVYPRLVQNLHADVVHVVDHGQGYLVAGLDASRTVVTCHDVILLALAAGRIGSLRVPLVATQLFRISLEAMKSATVVVADSTQTKRDLVDFVRIDPDKVRVIHPGLNHVFAPDRERGLALRRSLGLGEGPVILQIGRGFYKNLPSVLRVLARLREGGIDARVVRVGPSRAGRGRWPSGCASLPASSSWGPFPTPIYRAFTTRPTCCCSPRSTRGSAGRRWRPWLRGRRWSARARARSTRWLPTRRSRPIRRTSRRWPGTSGPR
jgi:glycosyltransferase involved in cell wall biosynthesis